MSFIHFMFFKLIKTTQKCLIFWNLLGALLKKSLKRIPNLSFIHFVSLKFFKTTQKYLLILNLLGSSYK